MIHKQKADELCSKIGPFIDLYDSAQRVDHDLLQSRTKQVAKIAVNEILETIKEDDDDISSATIFWTKVLIELETR